jgi:hypothetical protein
MPDSIWLPLLSEHGPWVLMVFYLLWRDMQKEKATREVLEKNTNVLTEMTTMLRERLPSRGVA